MSPAPRFPKMVCSSVKSSEGGVAVDRVPKAFCGCASLSSRARWKLPWTRVLVEGIQLRPARTETRWESP